MLKKYFIFIILKIIFKNNNLKNIQKYKIEIISIKYA